MIEWRRLKDGRIAVALSIAQLASIVDAAAWSAAKTNRAIAYGRKQRGSSV
jgi:hypothetical protein